jgi:hypothetical protein
MRAGIFLLLISLCVTNAYSMEQTLLSNNGNKKSSPRIPLGLHEGLATSLCDTPCIAIKCSLFNKIVANSERIKERDILDSRIMEKRKKIFVTYLVKVVSLKDIGYRLLPELQTKSVYTSGEKPVYLLANDTQIKGELAKILDALGVLNHYYDPRHATSLKQIAQNKSDVCKNALAFIEEYTK